MRILGAVWSPNPMCLLEQIGTYRPQALYSASLRLCPLHPCLKSGCQHSGGGLSVNALKPHVVWLYSVCRHFLYPCFEQASLDAGGATQVGLSDFEHEAFGITGFLL